CQKYITFPFTF
nr:immunoglobulin light chain junction region [Macaca mulatta]MOX47687.1 immunoglobulin light chain junction region [Macaca mulatta]MOX47786.1 immunoglobulin light chain junction region [Macaca mulatta]MOX47892.1 immunoglobulin light chain junction region [Macaca mulatta]MOX48075.1 immunoglobulin light chain junction region [Macaca mulatta]